MPQSRVLVVHPDSGVAAAMVRALLAADLAATAAPGHQAAALACDDPGIDLALVDEGAGGPLLGAHLRRVGVAAAIILISAGDVAGSAAALSHGADDYIVKPLSITELLARRSVVLRRAAGGVDAHVVDGDGDVRVDLASRKAFVAGTPVALTRKEINLLAELGRAVGATVRRQRLLVEVWGTDWQGGAQTIAVHVSTLRSKLGRPETIRTVRGDGYRLVAPP